MEADRLMQTAQETMNRRWQTYEHRASQEPKQFEQAGEPLDPAQKKGETRKVSPFVSKPFRA